MQRREFIGISAVGVTRLAADTALEDAVRRVGTLQRRKLGASAREISVLVGAGTWDRAAVEAGIRCGVNYWHKAEDWGRNVPPAILKNRDLHYCQVCVDRVRGNHETGRIDAEAFYQLVKRAVQDTGLRYFDDMQFHFGYHNIAELKNNRGFVSAFERLKKEGLARHLCLSQHSYNGNWLVRGGQSAAEILTEVADDGIYEHAQFAYSYGDEPALTNFVAYARKKGFGTIAMKSARGAGRMTRDRDFMRDFPHGATPYQALARWLTTRTQLDGAVIQLNSVAQFADTFSGAGQAMRSADQRAIGQMAAYADREACRLCNRCMEVCPAGVPVADILRCERYALDYGDARHARRLYAALPRRADACTRCDACVSRCPQSLRIPEKLAAVDRAMVRV
jgi:uncharacterized protein